MPRALEEYSFWRAEHFTWERKDISSIKKKRSDNPTRESKTSLWKTRINSTRSKAEKGMWACSLLALPPLFWLPFFSECASSLLAFLVFCSFQLFSRIFCSFLFIHIRNSNKLWSYFASIFSTAQSLFSLCWVDIRREEEEGPATPYNLEDHSLITKRKMPSSACLFVGTIWEQKRQNVRLVLPPFKF